MAPLASQSRAPELSFWRRLWLGLLGGPGYRRLAAEPRGAYPVFLALALATAIAAAAVSGWSVHRDLRAIVALWPEVPAFSIRAGVLRLASGSTAAVRIARGATVVVLEPGSGPADPLGDARAGLAITAHALLLRLGPSTAGDREIPLSSLGGSGLTNQTLGDLLRALASTGIWLGAAADVVYAVVRDFVRAAVIAWIAWIALRLFGRSAPWPEAWRVGLAAWSLPMIAEAVGAVVPVPGWALWMVASVYAMTGLVPGSTSG